MLWEGEPEEKTVERLQALGIESVVLDPCANRSPMGDFLTVMSENAKALDWVFRQDFGEALRVPGQAERENVHSIAR